MRKDFAQLLELLKNARLRALQTVNTGLVVTYWQVGKIIAWKLKNAEWGEGVVERFAGYVEQNSPELKGYNKRGLYRMVQFYETWADPESVHLLEPLLARFDEAAGKTTLQLVDYQHEFVSAALTQLDEKRLLTVLARLAWTHHLEILSRTKTVEERVFYLGLSVKDNYTSRELIRQIKSCLFERTMLSKSTLVLPEHPKQALLAEVFRDQYIFEFLNLPEPHDEHDLQKALLREIKNFLLELGRDFLFVGEEFRVQVGMKDFRIDLLFFHRDLQCLVAFELKVGEFEPEYLGKINFYLEALDRDVKKPHENPSIGILLCKTKDSEVVEYAMNRNMSPALVAEYELKLPSKKLLEEKLHGLLR